MAMGLPSTQRIAPDSSFFITRRQFCAIDSRNCTFPNIAMFGTSLQFRRYSSCDTRSLISPSKFLLAPDRNNPSKSSARFVQLKENETTSTHLHDQLTQDRHGDVGSPPATTCTISQGRAAWVKEKDELKNKRLLDTIALVGIESRPRGQEDGSAYKNTRNYGSPFNRNPYNEIETPFNKFPTSLKTEGKIVKQSQNGAPLSNERKRPGQEDGSAYENSEQHRSHFSRTSYRPSVPVNKFFGNANGHTIKSEDPSTSLKAPNEIAEPSQNGAAALNENDLKNTKYVIGKKAAPINDPLTKFPKSSKRIKETDEPSLNGTAVSSVKVQRIAVIDTEVIPLNHDIRQMLTDKIYGKVLVVDSVPAAKEVVKKLTNQYRHLVYACDTEVAKIDVKQETPVDHGEIICFSIYGGPNVDFGNGMSCIWVDVLDGGGEDILVEFAPFFEDPSIKKVWHNYSFDNHIVENYGIKLCGFHADTMHMARLWDSSRRTKGGYSLEALSGNRRLMSNKSGQPKSRLKDGRRSHNTTLMPYDDNLIGKISMKTIFGRKKLKKDGSEGKLMIIPPVEELQREERKPWICYSALDSINTLSLYESLKRELKMKEWNCDELKKGNMFDFYETHWRPFGELLVKMETEGMLVDRAYLADIEKVAIAEQQIAANRFRNWASSYSPDAKNMNVGSDAQLRQLFYGGIKNSNNDDEYLPMKKTFKIPNVDKVIEKGKKAPMKFRNLTLERVDAEIPAEIFTASGWPSMSGDALKTLAGKVSAEYDFIGDADLQLDDDVLNDEERTVDDEIKAQEPTENEDDDRSAYGTAYDAFGKGQKGKEACHAIAALCQVCSIDSLISNFILPLQGSCISGKNGRVHCSLNINTETGRLSARRPNLQNQPALEKDRYKIRQAFIAAPGNSLIVADYGQLELRILAHLADCKSMLNAFKAGGDFHSRTAMNMYPHIRSAVEEGQVLLEWDPQPGEDKPPVPLLKDAFASERRKAKMLNFSIAYGKTPIGLSRDWKVSVTEARNTVKLWYKERQEVKEWQEIQKEKARTKHCVHTLLGRARLFPSLDDATPSMKGHIERAAINTPVQGSAADVAMCAMLEISKNKRLKELGWKLLLQVHDEVILEGPTETGDKAKAIVVDCMSNPFDGKNILKVDLSVDAKCAKNWYSAK